MNAVGSSDFSSVVSDCFQCLVLAYPVNRTCWFDRRWTSVCHTSPMTLTTITTTKIAQMIRITGTWRQKRLMTMRMTNIPMTTTWAGRFDVRQPNVSRRSFLRDMNCCWTFTRVYRRSWFRDSKVTSRAPHSYGKSLLYFSWFCLKTFWFTWVI